MMKKKKKTDTTSNSIHAMTTQHGTKKNLCLLNRLHWQYLEAYLYDTMISQPMISHLLKNNPLKIVILTVSGSDDYYIGAHAGEHIEHKHNHLLKCHLLQICLALELVDESIFKQEIKKNCGHLRRLFAVKPEQLIKCADKIKNQIQHH